MLPIYIPATQTIIRSATDSYIYYFSDSTPGGVTTTAPADVGELIQFLGKRDTEA